MVYNQLPKHRFVVRVRRKTSLNGEGRTQTDHWFEGIGAAQQFHEGIIKQQLVTGSTLLAVLDEQSKDGSLPNYPAK